MAAGGADFVTIASLAVRQAFGGTQLCGTTDAPFLFLKEISSDGNVQTVDVIFPFHPILIYTNPTLLKYLLDPLFINQEAGQYPVRHFFESSMPDRDFSGVARHIAEANPSRQLFTLQTQFVVQIFLCKC